ncbi:MAG: SCO family protein [Proteobacteria bacterium]|nr:SCO family protein [Pseudomonadota bacterium]
MMFASVGLAHAHPDGTDAPETTLKAPASLGDQILPPPPTYKANDVTVEEHLSAQVPLDAKFSTAEGKVVTLGDVLADGGELPTILTFNYSDCPMLCSVMLNGLTAALPGISQPAAQLGDDRKVAFRVGEQYRIVTIDLEPKESLDKLGKLRDRYVARLPEAQQARARAGGWTFLAAMGDASQIKRVADAVGFKYTYVTERAEWAHPAALIFLSSVGRVTRYVYGIEFPLDTMRESILAAGTAEPKAASGYMLRCYHYDPEANSHARAGVTALRVGAGGFVVLLAGLGVLHLVRRNRSEALRS